MAAWAISWTASASRSVRTEREVGCGISGGTKKPNESREASCILVTDAGLLFALILCVLCASVAKKLRRDDYGDSDDGDTVAEVVVEIPGRKYNDGMYEVINVDD